jgi:acetaldehyde dehydrogenase (acetylating)
MLNLDKDLLSIQEARSLAVNAHAAQKVWAKASQEQVDRVCAAMAEAAFLASERLGRMACEETGYGYPEHKKIKNEFASRYLWQSIKDVKTVGVLRRDLERRVVEIAWPMGVVAGLVPSTNPTSTVFAKVLSAVKARDGIIIAPHPAAAKCTLEAARVMAQASVQAGAPQGLIGCFENISLQGTQELMQHKYIDLILAHSVGKPAYGVGPGNVPVYVDRSADLQKAARYIVASKAFDCSTICASEQAVVADKPIAAELARLFVEQGAYFATEEQTAILRRLLFNPDGGMNTATVGKPPQFLAALAGFEVPPGTRIIVVRLTCTGKEEPLSREKLTTVLGWYEEDGWEAGCERSIELIHFGGRGHTQIIHATDENVILQFGLEKPVFRILVNTMGTLGAVGFTTGLMPSMTLGAGGEGGSITGDNITVHHLYNVKRLAYELNLPPAEALRTPGSDSGLNAREVEAVVRQVIGSILSQK